MNGPIYKFFRVRWTAAWYQLGQAEQEAMLEKIGDLGKQFGVKPMLVCNSSWSNEGWSGFGVEEYPDMESVYNYNAALQAANWFAYMDCETMLGTAFQAPA